MSYPLDIFWKYTPITAISPINLSPLIISSEIPYSFHYLFKEPIRFFSEQQKDISKQVSNFSKSWGAQFSTDINFKPIKHYEFIRNFIFIFFFNC